jgi:adenosylcobinamide-GDP ribazoletransferase
VADAISERDEWMRHWGPLYPGLVALWSLSIVPPPRGLAITGDDRVRSAPWFPAIGAVLGLVLAGLAAILMAVDLAPVVPAAVVVTLGLALTGARLERGMAAAFERGAAGAGAWQADRLSAPGVIALVAFLALRGAGLLGAGTDHWLAVLVITHMSARWAVLFLLEIGDRIDEPGGHAILPVGRVSWLVFALASLMVVAVAVVLAWSVGLLALLAAAAVAFAGGLYFQRRAGGLTEPALAAVACASEIAALLVLAAGYPA